MSYLTKFSINVMATLYYCTGFILFSVCTRGKICLQFVQSSLDNVQNAPQTRNMYQSDGHMVLQVCLDVETCHKVLTLLEIYASLLL